MSCWGPIASCRGCWDQTHPIECDDKCTNKDFPDNWVDGCKKPPIVVTPAPIKPVKPVTPAPITPVKPVTPAPITPVKPVIPAPIKPVKPVTPDPIIPVKPVTAAPSTAVTTKPTKSTPGACNSVFNRRLCKRLGGKRVSKGLEGCTWEKKKCGDDGSGKVPETCNLGHNGKRCKAIEGKRVLEGLTGCYWLKRKCYSMLPSQFCNEYKKKRVCNQSMNIQKTRREAPLDAPLGCFYYSGFNWKGEKYRQCRPKTKKVMITKCLKLGVTTKVECEKLGCNIRGVKDWKCIGTIKMDPYEP